MTHYTKKRIETVSNSFRKNALSVAISALSTTLAGVRGLKGGVYVTNCRAGGSASCVGGESA